MPSIWTFRFPFPSMTVAFWRFLCRLPIVSLAHFFVSNSMRCLTCLYFHALKTEISVTTTWPPFPKPCSLAWSPWNSCEFRTRTHAAQMHVTPFSTAVRAKSGLEYRSCLCATTLRGTGLFSKNSFLCIHIAREVNSRVPSLRSWLPSNRLTTFPEGLFLDLRNLIFL